MVFLRLHDDIARFYTGTKFAPRCQNRPFKLGRNRRFVVCTYTSAILSFSVSESDESSDEDTYALDLIFRLCLAPNLSSPVFFSLGSAFGLRLL